MKRFGLIGKTLKHSFSKKYFTQKFIELGVDDFAYDNYELENITGFPGLLKNNADLRGLNVTIPYKEAILPYLHETSEEVKNIGACNCINIIEGRLYGFNTDATAFARSLLPQLKAHHTKALVLGSGGAAKAVRFALTQANIDYKIVSRSNDEYLNYQQLSPDVLNQHLLIINTTPLGMFPNAGAPAIPYHLLTPKHFLFDLIYNPAKTLFLEKGEMAGAQIANGAEMLVLQAEASWDIWSS